MVFWKHKPPTRVCDVHRLEITYKCRLRYTCVSCDFLPISIRPWVRLKWHVFSFSLVVQTICFVWAENKSQIQLGCDATKQYPNSRPLTGCNNKRSTLKRVVHTQIDSIFASTLRREHWARLFFLFNLEIATQYDLLNAAINDDAFIEIAAFRKK